MLWSQWRHSALLLLLSSPPPPTHARHEPWTDSRKSELREQTRELWYHGFDAYMKYAFPMDELRPLTCQGRGPDWLDPTNTGMNDVLGNYSMTLVDSLSTLVVLHDLPTFSRSVRNVLAHVPNFDLDVRPQVFESTIRVMGGLLSAHVFASEERWGMSLGWYDGQLLTLAEDLGKRLLRAFYTPTGIPYARVNLRHGVLPGETTESCSAGAASLLLEFATLSRLTGNTVYELAARKAFYAIWNRRSEIGLVGNAVNVVTGAWVLPLMSGIGAGIDSFYEYALKAYILLGEPDFLDVWHESYAAVMKHVRGREGFWFRNTWMDTGLLGSTSVDSLSAFWPGLQVLAGDVQNAVKSHLVYWNLWRRYAGMPERFNFITKDLDLKGYPLRPEFIESTYFLYRATKDTFYLDVGARVLSDLQRRTKVPCGLAVLQNVETGEHQDRMESFVLSETLKYLYLLFDEDNFFHRTSTPFIFTTEGHPLVLPPHLLHPPSAVRRELRQAEQLSCPAYLPPLIRTLEFATPGTGLVGGVRDRFDVETARHLVGGRETGEEWWDVDGWCELPEVEEYAFDFILSADARPKPEDLAPGPEKLRKVADGFLLNDVTGIRAHIVRRLDDRGYDITRLGPHRVLTGQTVYVNDTRIIRPTPSPASRESETITLHFIYQSRTAEQQGFEWDASVWPALFGPHPSGMRVNARILAPSDPYGCSAVDPPPPGTILDPFVWLVKRGECTFLRKLSHAKAAGARGVVVTSDESERVTPALGEDESWDWTEGDTWLVLMSKEETQGLWDRIRGKTPGEMRVGVGGRELGAAEREKGRERWLYVDGKPLVNTVLLD